MEYTRFPHYTRDSARRLIDLLEQRIAIIDGAMGTVIQGYKLGEQDYRGEDFLNHESELKGNNDLLNLTRPDVIADIHRAYLEAGAHIIETNTFNATRTAQADYGLESITDRINTEGARLARQAVDDWMTCHPQQPCFVAGVLGPTPKTASISPDVNDPAARNISFDELRDDYRQSADAFKALGEDLSWEETLYHTLNPKAALLRSRLPMDACGVELPIMVSATFPDTSGRLLSGQTGRPFAGHRPCKTPIVGSNCGRRFKEVRPFLEDLAGACHCYFSAHLNADCPTPSGSTMRPRGIWPMTLQALPGRAFSTQQGDAAVRRRIT